MELLQHTLSFCGHEEERSGEFSETDAAAGTITARSTPLSSRLPEYHSFSPRMHSSTHSPLTICLLWQLTYNEQVAIAVVCGAGSKMAISSMTHALSHGLLWQCKAKTVLAPRLHNDNLIFFFKSVLQVVVILYRMCYLDIFKPFFNKFIGLSCMILHYLAFGIIRKQKARNELYSLCANGENTN